MSELEAWGIEKRIFVIRGVKVLLDRDLAELYGVPTKALNLAVKRNAMRFPVDFVFQLTEQEMHDLRFHSETSRWGGSRYQAYAFTENGVAMLSGVLRSLRAILVNVEIMRTFNRLRNLVASHKELGAKLTELESKVQSHDKDIRELFQGLHEMASEPEAPRRRIGFKPESDGLPDDDHD